MDGSPPDSSVHGIPQARLLEWVAILISRGSSQPRDQTPISYIGRQILHCLCHEENPNSIYSGQLAKLTLTYFNATIKKIQL